ncbi:MAG TPA: penicillin acylase family protein [Aridibacter sp.]|nr:penicillin acylase family protein [Aridibacter sp.]
MNRLARFVVSLSLIVIGASACLAQQETDAGPGLAVKGLADEVIVRRDSRSIPYIEAKNDADLYFAQGYETARDRLWQMDLLRRLASGNLAELFGSDVLEQDKRWRRYGFYPVADLSLRSVGPDMRKALESYAAGVNAYIDSLDKKSLPTEFQILQYEPDPWKPSDTMIIGKVLAEALSSTWTMDIARIRAEALPEDKRSELLDVTDPRDVVLFGKNGDASEVKSQKAKVKSAGGAGQGKSKKERGKSKTAAQISVEDLDALEAIASADAAVRKRSLEMVGLFAEDLAASNNWVISGKRTLDGKAILANDPHIQPAAPGIWYLTHLSAPGVRVSGVTFPGVPGIVLGHNEYLAWGATNVGPDVQDVYLEEFNDKGEYLTPNGWKKPEVRKETIKVRKGQGPDTDSVEYEVVETRNGPVIGELGGRKYSLRWTARSEKNQEFETFFLLNRAKGWEGFKKALSDYGGPMQNFVYADVEGNIGWHTAGKVPIRRKGDGSLPYEGKSSDGDWTGYIPFEELPNLYNPPSGFIVTANQRIVGTDYKYQQITRQFAPPWRARRIYDLISGNTKITMNDVSDIQLDVFNIPVSEFAREVVKRNAASKETSDLLKGWDGRMTADSKAANAANSLRNCVADRISKANEGMFLGYVRERVLPYALKTNDPKWLPEGVTNYDDLIRECDSSKRGNGVVMPWGEVNAANFNHPLSAAPLIGGRFQVRYTNVDGSGQTPNVGSGVSMRHISKPGSWDETRFVIPLGQSGVPGSPNWTDQFESWRTGKPEVFPFSVEAVTKAAETSLKMVPAN